MKKKPKPRPVRAVRAWAFVNDRDVIFHDYLRVPVFIRKRDAEDHLRGYHESWKARRVEIRPVKP